MKFLRQDTNKEKCLKKKWRKPRGRHSKLRLNKAGHRKKPSQGFRKPHKERAQVNLIHNLQELSQSKAPVLLSSKLGLRKKLAILKKAQELNLQILNIKNIDEFIKKTTEEFEKKKKETKEKETKKKKSKEEAVKKAETKKEEEKKEEEEEEEKPEDKTKGLPQKTARPKDVPQKQTTQIARATAPKQK